jgi:hypothetical protein
VRIEKERARKEARMSKVEKGLEKGEEYLNVEG